MLKWGIISFFDTCLPAKLAENVVQKIIHSYLAGLHDYWRVISPNDAGTGARLTGRPGIYMARRL